MKRIRTNIRAAAGVILVVILIIAVGIVGVLSFIPSGSCEVQTTVSMSEAQFIIGSWYSVNSVTAQNIGSSPILDWGALGLVFPSLDSKYVLTVNIAGHQVQRDESKVLPTLSIGAGPVTDLVTVTYVPQGQQTVTAQLTVDGGQQGSATTTINVSC